MRISRVKLLSCLAVVCLAVAMLVVGIWAAGTQTINLKGQVDFSIGDPSLYVKDIRIKNSMEDASSEGETIDNFVPGYVNTTMNLNLGQIDNSTGGLSIYIDIINTTDITYVASTTSSISGADITVSGTINGDAVSQSNILTTDTPSGTVEIVISAPDIDTLDLEQISIVLEERNIEIEIVNLTPDLGSATYSVDGEQVTLTATLNNNVAFYGWAENSEDGYVPSDLPTYTFEFTDGTPTTYYPIFKALTVNYSTYYDDDMGYYLKNGEAGFRLGTTTSENIVIASTVNIEGENCSVTFASESAIASNSNIKTITFPSTFNKLDLEEINMIGMAPFYNLTLDSVYFRAGGTIDAESLGFNLSGESISTQAMIIDSEEIYAKIDNVNEFYGGSVPRPNRVESIKLLSTIEVSSASIFGTMYTFSTTEVINGRTYNVFTKI